VDPGEDLEEAVDLGEAQRRTDRRLKDQEFLVKVMLAQDRLLLVVALIRLVEEEEVLAQWQMVILEQSAFNHQ
jgi:hypothetical protein